MDPKKNPGLNGLFRFQSTERIGLVDDSFGAADHLGQGSVQDSVKDTKGSHLDQPFWDALNEHIENLHAVFSGHGRPVAPPAKTC